MPEYESWVEYRPIPDFPNYLAGSDGSVWSNIKGHRNRPYAGATLADIPIPTGEWTRMRPSVQTGGYLIVTLSHPSRRRKSHLVHKLILLAFVGPPRPGQQCRHDNRVRGDNRLENLSWGTPQENSADRIRHGTTAKGAKNGGAKLTEEQVHEMRRLRRDEGAKYADLAELFGVSFTTVYRICARSHWT